LLYNHSVTIFCIAFAFCNCWKLPTNRRGPTHELKSAMSIQFMHTVHDSYSSQKINVDSDRNSDGNSNNDNNSNSNSEGCASAIPEVCPSNESPASLLPSGFPSDAPPVAPGPGLGSPEGSRRRLGPSPVMTGPTDHTQLCHDTMVVFVSMLPQGL